MGLGDHPVFKGEKEGGQQSGCYAAVKVAEGQVGTTARTHLVSIRS